MRIVFRIYMFKRAATLQNTTLRFHVISETMTWPFCLVIWLQHMAVGTGIQRASLIASSCLK